VWLILSKSAIILSCLGGSIYPRGGAMLTRHEYAGLELLDEEHHSLPREAHQTGGAMSAA